MGRLRDDFDCKVISMFDGIKIELRDQLYAKQLLANKRLEFIINANEQTGEILKNIANYKGFKITVFPSGYVQLVGSLHKYFNSGLHNFDDFTHTSLEKVIDALKIELDLNPQIAPINNLEFGVNINTLFDPNAFINSLHCFKWRPFNIMQMKGSGMGKECRGFTQHIVKIYNKGLQYRQPIRILRIEKKVVTMRALKVCKLTLSDLLNPALWEHCKNELLQMVDDILLNETIDARLLSKNELRIYQLVVNQSNWRRFSRDQKKRYKKAFNQIVYSYGREKYRPTIVTLINDKADNLAKA